MDVLIERSNSRIRYTDTRFKRYLFDRIDWNDRLIIIKGARGVGKTTLLLQYIREQLGLREDVLYVSLDDMWFTDNRLFDLADHFVKTGGRYLFIDEAHKYPGWAREVKNVYDNHPELNMVLTSSSALQIIDGQADLSRRAVVYEMNEMSFREFLLLHHQIDLGPWSLEEIIRGHKNIALEVVEKIRPLKYFKDFLKLGAYPFSIENPSNYHQRLAATVRLTLEVDFPAILNIEYNSVVKLKKLLYVIATSAPFKPNISKLSQKIGVSRDTLLRYLNDLSNAHLINLLKSEKSGMSYLSKPEKIYLNTSDLFLALEAHHVDPGTIREAFFFNQLTPFRSIYDSEWGDFNIDNRWVVEIGGKNKNNRQIHHVPNAYLAIDDLEIGYKNKIPLWLFGFTY